MFVHAIYSKPDDTRVYSRYAPVATLRFTCRNIRNGTGRAENDGDYATLFSDNAVRSRDARGGI